MDEHVTTAIGRVVPSYEGTWSSNKVYDKLDNVLYDGSTYVALRSVPAGIQPGSDSNRWQLIARKGDVGNISHVYANAASSDQPTASATIGGTPDDVTLEFEFGLPKGDTGDPAAITHVNASATQIEYNKPPEVTATITGDPGDATLNFNFKIPGGEGSVSSVDGVGSVGGNVALKAVSFDANQIEDPNSPRYISDNAATIARNNIRAAYRETKINKYPLVTDINLTAEDVGAYAIPSGGIPKTDLASAVQTSLGKADSAYQKPSGGILKTDLVSAIQTSLGKADTAYQKPSGGIPKTDLASGVLPTAYTGTPKKDETTAKPGSSTQWARGDHVHPTDDTRQQKITVTGILKGGGSGIINSATAGKDYITPTTNYSQVITKSSNYTLAASDSGKTIVIGTSTSGDVTITINQTVLGSLPLGAEIAFIKDNSPSKVARLKIVNIGFGNESAEWTSPNANGVYAVIPKRYGMIALKKIFDTNSSMMLFGNVEVTS